MPTRTRILAAARLELLLVTWRVGQALRCLKDIPDRMTEMRWNHGIARELVSTALPRIPTARSDAVFAVVCSRRDRHPDRR